ncbi:NACHT domain-containing protein [Scytonema sp. PCC 10023]|uniref:NACHT domain-containing protein n=1 Tax=Scytonema sp. PCC 10023 TaxID=1680591 RepID=UPI0039C687F0
MATPDELKVIIEKLAAGTATDEEIEAFRQACEGSDKITVQVAKYINNVNQAQDSQFGDAPKEPQRDRLSQNADTEASQAAKLEQNKLSVDELVQKVRSRFHDDIQRLHGTMPLLGVDHWVDLGKLFVDVNILEEISSSRKSELDDLWQDFSAGVGEYSSYLSLDRIGLGKQQKRMPGLTVLAKNINLMVLGKPGSGKTTFLQRIVTECNKGKLQPHRIPVLIKLREFVDDGRNFEYSLERYLTQQWRLSEVETELVLSQGRALILLDGLDEVTGENGRKISKKIKQFVRSYPQNQLVITCRTQSQESRFERFDYVEVTDFNEAQVNAFAKHWFKVVCSNTQERKAKARQFLDKLYLEENKTIRELAITPILLSLTCAVFQAQGKFYSKRSKLYEEGLELLLEKWDKSRSIERDEIYRDLSVERKQELLSYLAVKKFEQRQYVLFEQEEIEGYIAEFLEISRRDSRVVLRAIEAQHGLLIERSQKVWSFSHLTFQEYFVAKWFCDRARWQELAINVTQTKWREVFLLVSQSQLELDSLLRMMKKQIDLVLIEDKNLQEFLEWIRLKSNLVKAPYKLAAIRAFYFTLVTAHTYTFDTILPNKLATSLFLDFNLIRAYVPKGNIYSDFSLAGALDSNLESAIGIVHGHGHNFHDELELPREDAITDILKRLHNSRFSYPIDSAQGFKFSMALANDCVLPPTFYHALQHLKAELHSLTQNYIQLYHQHWEVYSTRNEQLESLVEKCKKWWQVTGKEWHEKLRLLIAAYRYIEIGWKVNENQQMFLQLYYDANKVIIDCLNATDRVSNEVKDEIEETLLLPIAEIEKRNREK